MGNRKGQQGFTLVEMAVVLVIIGLILGAVMIGKDVQRNAEYAKIKQKFVDQWVVAYNTYHSRVGVPPGDDQTAPRLMINGANYTNAAGPISGGDMTGVTPPAAICHGSAGPGMGGFQPGDAFSLHALMDRAGVRMPPGRAEGFEDRYVYLDSNGNPQEVQVCFQWNAPATASGAGNVMVLSGLTPDLARSLDQMIDGKPDAREGILRQAGVGNDTSGTPGTEWGANNTYAQGATGTPTGTGANLDEDHVITLVAHLKMNQ